MLRLTGRFCIATLLAALTCVPAVEAQVVISVGVPPVCSYGYFDFAPYACAPVGFYGPGYFYDGVFLGMGPWAGWGYNHGWGSHRFSGSGGGRYTGGRSVTTNRGHVGGTSVRYAESGRINHAGSVTNAPRTSSVQSNASRNTLHAGTTHSQAAHTSGHTASSQSGGGHNNSPHH